MTAKEQQTNTADHVKTTMFNLIILDESGSMSGITKQTISGCNETINTIMSAQKEKGDRVRNLVSIYAFQSNGPVPSRYLIKNVKAEDVRHITENDYRPWGATPLLDAVGSTLSELRAVSETHEDATGAITIITDGMENSSTRYSWQKVKSLIEWFKEMGWTVNLIGANIDLKAMASQFGVNTENTMAYTQDDAGTHKMWKTFSESARMAYMNECDAVEMNVEERVKARKMRSKSFFKK